MTSPLQRHISVIRLCIVADKSYNECPAHKCTLGYAPTLSCNVRKRSTNRTVPCPRTCPKLESHMIWHKLPEPRPLDPVRFLGCLSSVQLPKRMRKIKKRTSRQTQTGHRPQRPCAQGRTCAELATTTFNGRKLEMRLQCDKIAPVSAFSFMASFPTIDRYRGSTAT